MSLREHFKMSDQASLEVPTDSRGRKVWVNFLPNIDFGHLLTMVGFAAGMALQWNAFDRRLTIAEEQLKQVSGQLTESRSNNRETLNEVKSDVKGIKEAVTQVQQSMALTAYKLEQQIPRSK